jgi:Zn-dependent protease with chaperone function
VLAHEVAHIKCEHGVWITAANALALGLYSIGGSLGRALGDRIQGGCAGCRKSPRVGRHLFL